MGADGGVETGMIFMEDGTKPFPDGPSAQSDGLWSFPEFLAAASAAVAADSTVRGGEEEEERRERGGGEAWVLSSSCWRCTEARPRNQAHTQLSLPSPGLKSSAATSARVL